MPQDAPSQAAQRNWRREAAGEAKKGLDNFPADPIAPLRAKSRTLARLDEPAEAYDFPSRVEDSRSGSVVPSSPPLVKTGMRKNNPNNAFVKKS